MQVCYPSLTKPVAAQPQRRKKENENERRKKRRWKKRGLMCVDRAFWSRMAYHYRRWAPQSSCHFSKARPVFRTSPAPYRRIWSKSSFCSPFAYGPKDIRLFLWRLWLCSADWQYTCIRLLETAGKPSSPSKSGASYCPPSGVLHPSSFQCMAGLVFLKSHGIHYDHASRPLLASAWWESSPSLGTRGCTWRSPLHQGWQQATSRRSPDFYLFRCKIWQSYPYWYVVVHHYSLIWTRN